MTMKLGEKSRIAMVGDKGYGPNGFPAWGIPPNAGLTFELEVTSIQ
jgi:FKBP-type peptidyl-prolyl cis-trans isomerase